MRTLAEGTHDAPLVVDAFLLRALASGGYEMALVACARCGQVAREGSVHRAVLVPAGGVVCHECRAPGTVLMSESGVRLLAALAEGDWPYADASDARTRREASGAVAAHLQWNLERGLRSLALVEGR